MEVSKFWTKTKIIILITVLVVIGLIVGIIFINRARLKKEYIKLENRITNDAAPNYMTYEQISLKDNEYRKINIRQIQEDKLIPPRASDCDGYVIVENSSGLYKYDTYLKCKNIYMTNGYGKQSSLKKNTAKTQTEKDTKKPTITLLGSSKITVGLGEKFKDPGASASDNIDGDISKKIKIEGTVDTSIEGTYTLTYTVSDKSGNTSSKKRTVIVSKDVNTKAEEKDKIVPVITFTNENAYQRICKGDKVNISKDGVYGYSAHDDVDGDITDRVKVTGQIGTVSVEGEYTIDYSVKDKAGNEAKSTRKYSVINCNQSTQPASQPAPSNNQGTNNSGGGNYTPVSPDTSTSSSSSSNPQNPDVNTNVTTNATGINAPDTVYVSVGGTTSINASVLPSNASNKTLTYKVINPNIATVDTNGIVTGKTNGETRVTISTSNGKTKGVIIIVE